MAVSPLRPFSTGPRPARQLPKGYNPSAVHSIQVFRSDDQLWSISAIVVGGSLLMVEVGPLWIGRCGYRRHPADDARHPALCVPTRVPVGAPDRVGADPGGLLGPRHSSSRSRRKPRAAVVPCTAAADPRTVRFRFGAGRLGSRARQPWGHGPGPAPGPRRWPAPSRAQSGLPPGRTPPRPESHLPTLPVGHSSAQAQLSLPYSCLAPPQQFRMLIGGERTSRQRCISRPPRTTHPQIQPSRRTIFPRHI